MARTKTTTVTKEAQRGETKHRSVRIPDEVWESAQAKAAENHETITAVMVRLLLKYQRGEVS